MTDAKDVQIIKTTNGNGGAPDAGQAASATPRNIFGNLAKGDIDDVGGGEQFKCFFVKNNSAETMDAFSWWLASKKKTFDTKVQWGFDPLGKYNWMGFDGTDDYLNLGDRTGLWSKTKTKFSFSFIIWAHNWAGPSTSGGLDRDILRHDGTSNWRFNVDSISGGANLRFNIKDGTGSIFAASIPTIPTGEAHTVVCTFDGSLVSNNMKIYLDGTLIQQTTLVGTLTLGAGNNLYLGGSTTQLSHKGYIRRFYYWDNKELTQNEVDDVVDRSPSAPTPSYKLDIDEGSGDPVDDISGTFTGVRTNGAFWVNKAQVIADKYTEPDGVTWHDIEDKPTSPNVGRVLAGDSFAVWQRIIYPQDPIEGVDDQCTWRFSFKVTSGGTGGSGGGNDGGSGGGSGGNDNTVEDYKIAFLGDMGTTNATKDVVDLIKSQNYDMVLTAGDMDYGDFSGWKSLFSFLYSAGKMEVTLGNHDSASNYKNLFGYKANWWAKKWRNILFIGMDFNGNIDVGSSQYNFVNDTLTKYANDETVLWRVGIGHQPWFGSNSTHDYDEIEQVEALHRLFQNNKVSLMVCAHNHNAQRSKQVSFNSNNPKSPTIVDSSSPFSRSAQALIEVICGIGGRDGPNGDDNLYPLGSQPGFMAYQNNSYNGVWEVVSSGHGVTWTCQFRNTKGETFDTFTYNST